MKIQFRSSWDALLIFMTLGISVLLGLSVIYVDSLIVGAICIMLILTGLIFGVYGYSLQNNELRIIRLGWSSDVPFSDILDVEYTPDAMMGSLRKFGIGGFFSYCGLFKNRVVGDYKAYATHRKNTVVITKRSGKKIVVTPSEPERFTAELKKAAGKVKSDQ